MCAWWAAAVERADGPCGRGRHARPGLGRVRQQRGRPRRTEAARMALLPGSERWEVGRVQVRLGCTVHHRSNSQRPSSHPIPDNSHLNQTHLLWASASCSERPPQKGTRLRPDQRPVVIAARPDLAVLFVLVAAAERPRCSTVDDRQRRTQVDSVEGLGRARSRVSRGSRGWTSARGGRVVRGGGWVESEVSEVKGGGPVGCESSVRASVTDGRD